MNGKKSNTSGGMAGWLQGIVRGGKKKKRWSSTETQTVMTLGRLTNDGSTLETSSGDIDYKPLPVIGHMPTNKQYQVVLTGMAVALLLGATSVGVYLSKSDATAKSLAASGEMLRGIQKVDKGLMIALAKPEEGFDLIETGAEQIDQKLALMDQSLSGGTERASFTPTAELWKKNKESLNRLAEKRTAIEESLGATDGSESAAKKLQSSLDKLEAGLLQSSGSRQSEMAVVLFGRMWGQRMASAGRDSAAAASLKEEEILSFSQFLQGMIQGSASMGLSGLPEGEPARALAERALADAAGMAKAVRTVGGQNKDLLIAQDFRKDLLENTEMVSSMMERLAWYFEGEKKSLGKFLYSGIFGGVLALAMLILAGLIMTKDSQRQRSVAKKERASTQGAIMRMLDEMGALADGDLTVRATVTEEITGAIADSVNFAISQLAELVGKITSVSRQTQNATKQAMDISAMMLRSGEQQAKDIAEAGREVLKITEAINQVSRRIEDSKKVAKQSVENSTRGMTAVSASIDGIRSIQDNVEETGKRIRRLTEQSKQISEIVDLIADISERTSVLAINATVQATKAGAAGKGFKVVADSVQDLAHQASDATRRIGALINAIQTDIQGAGAAMEKTTEEAQKGAKLAEDTGNVLAEISDVSTALAEIVEETSAQVSSSSKAATHVSQTMRKVLDSVGESAASTKKTAGAIEEITKLSEQLKDSIAGFKL